jgi:putative cardiolipin synthase
MPFSAMLPFVAQRSRPSTAWCQHLAAVALSVYGALALSGCASLPPPVERPATQALADVRGTPLERMVTASAPNAEVSGFRVVSSGEEAYGVLASLADRAQRTLDLQYYLIRSDGSSRGVLQRVYAAAERGVRVRLLVDDLNTAGQDAGLMRLTQHRNITVRLYNPFPSGRMSTMGRVMTSLTDISRINQRMHNKMFVADNVIALTGGRNLGDAYFLHDPKSNFLDLDIVVAGPAVKTLSSTFDAFWNNPLAYPVEAIAKKTGGTASSPPDKAAPDPAFPPMPASAGSPTTPDPAAANPKLPVAPPPRASTFAQEVAIGQIKLVWAPSRVIADKPSKIESEGKPDADETITGDIVSLLRSARSEVVIITPYFVPGDRGVEIITALQARGVKVRVLTNSLATTDAPAVHIGYAKYREALLRAGVELHELRGHIDSPRSKVGSFGSSSASLHAKTVVIDRSTALIGSMNMDPRSARLNTEMGVVIKSPVIAQQVVRLYEDVSASGYRLEIANDGRMHWKSNIDNSAQDTYHEPEAKLWLRIGLKLLSPFAPEEML